jgi:hypothetical protein
VAEAYVESVEPSAHGGGGGGASAGGGKPTVALCVEAAEAVVIKRWAPYERVRVSE